MMTRTLRRLAALFIAVAIGGWLRRALRRTEVDWSPPTGRVHGGALAARIAGDTGSPIVLLHGLVSSGLTWGAAFDELARHHQLVVPDLLGFGRSPRPPAGYGPREHADAVLACFDEIVPGRAPFVIGAHSAGCLVAIHLAAAYPERVSAIVGFAPPLYRTVAEARALVGGLGPMARLLTLDTSLSQRVCEWVCEHRSLAADLAQLTRPDLPAPIARDGVEHTWASYSETLRRVVLAADARALLTSLHMPVHLVAGDADRVAPPSLLDGLADQPNVAVTTWPGLGHELPLLRPHDCVNLISAAIEAS